MLCAVLVATEAKEVVEIEAEVEVQAVVEPSSVVSPLRTVVEVPAEEDLHLHMVAHLFKEVAEAEVAT